MYQNLGGLRKCLDVGARGLLDIGALNWCLIACGIFNKPLIRSPFYVRVALFLFHLPPLPPFPFLGLTDR